jgi:hypothetical protein
LRVLLKAEYAAAMAIQLRQKRYRAIHRVAMKIANILTYSAGKARVPRVAQLHSGGPLEPMSCMLELYQ